LQSWLKKSGRFYIKKRNCHAAMASTKAVLALTVVNVCLTAVNVGLAFSNMVIVKIFARTLAGVRDADD
jgi:hypothetical protein